ncbi:hypothetical protein KGF54_001870 [Candida jiufengensis]|uniref:uncharacterized protein n=1 Tax=Candida jiufengensis TaxID=497108 RepID=UPI002224BD87|nr:uncharacterized protein KGF54_001870 [Candida jiufengensis]KAI5955309.1 hypothetical protein KGF54_001870 [Candida jiufengensis]
MSRKRQLDSENTDYNYLSSNSTCSSTNSQTLSSSPIQSTLQTYNFIPSSPIRSKKVQLTKIHTEVHQKTINMMIQAQLELQRQEKLNVNMCNEVNNDTIVEEHGASTYFQQPYW